jgi:glycosyltransferase involved in cell wall biosynthesis
VMWEPIDFGTERPMPVEPEQSRFTHLLHRRIEHDTVVVHLPPTRMAVHVTDDADRLKLAFTTDETDRIPEQWVRGLDPMDRVVVPSAFNRDVFAASGVTAPLWVAPYVGGLELGAPPFEHPALGDRYVFYTIGVWTTRKAMAETVAAFADAFAGSDEVALVIKTGLVDHQAAMAALVAARAIRRSAGRPSWTDRVRRRLGSSEMGASPSASGAPLERVETWWSLAQLLAARPSAPPVLLVPETWSEAALAGLHARGDCLVSLNRGEGFGLTILDAARASNPVVVTGWGAPVEIVGDDHPLLVDHTLIATADDVRDDWMRVSPDERWAVADHDDAVDKLRWVFAHQDEARAIGTGLAQRAEARFGVQAVADALATALDR